MSTSDSGFVHRTLLVVAIVAAFVIVLLTVIFDAAFTIWPRLMTDFAGYCPATRLPPVSVTFETGGFFGLQGISCMLAGRVRRRTVTSCGSFHPEPCWSTEGLRAERFG